MNMALLYADRNYNYSSGDSLERAKFMGIFASFHVFIFVWTKNEPASSRMAFVHFVRDVQILINFFPLI